MNNLVSNAINHSPEKGESVLRLAKPDGEHIRLSVIDQGPGVPEASQGRIFERFYRAPGLASQGLGVVDFLIKPAAPADIRRVVEFVLGPPRSRLAQALHAARSGQPETALGILEAAHQDPDPTESCWIKALKRVVEADAGGEMTQLEEEVRSCFPALAFNPPA